MLRLRRKIDLGDILKVYPNGNYVEVFGIIYNTTGDHSEQRWLRVYWNDHYGIILPYYFDIIRCIFKPLQKDIKGNPIFSGIKKYNYPDYRKCFKRPIFQRLAKRKFKNQ